MNGAGAVIIHDSLLWDPRFDSITHSAGTWASWSDTQYLLTHQLWPKALHAADGVAARMDINFSSAISKRGDYAIALTGTNIPNRGLDQMVRLQYGLAGSFTELCTFDPYFIEHVDGTWHMVFLTDRTLTTDFDTIRMLWDSSVAGAVGGVYPGRYRQAPELGSRGWEIVGPDRNTFGRAAGGQKYGAHAHPQIDRQLRVPMGALKSQTAMASPSARRALALPSPVISGTNLPIDGGFVYTSASTSQGTVTFGGLFAGYTGQYARIDYSAHFRGNSSTGTVNSFRWSLDDHELLNGPLRGARGSAIIKIATDDLVLRAVAGNASNAHSIRVDGVSLINADDNFQWGPGQDDSLLGIWMRHGNTRPLIMMQRPSDPLITQVTGMYGRLQGVPGITHRAGAYFQSRLVMEEER